MQSEDQYMERTPDLVAKVRAMRQSADREMNRFTRIADYDVRRVVGNGPKPTLVSDETVVPARAGERARKRTTTPTSDQASIQFAPAPAERGDGGEDA